MYCAAPKVKVSENEKKLPSIGTIIQQKLLVPMGSKEIETRLLLIAAQGGDVDAGRMLIANKVKINSAHEESGDMALHFAAACGKFDFIAMLLEL